MKKRTKVIIAALACMMLIVGSVAVIARNQDREITVGYRDIQIFIDGELFIPKDVNGVVVEPFIYDGTTYLPVRAISEALDKTVDWDGETSTIYVGPRPDEEPVEDNNIYLGTVVKAYQKDGIAECDIVHTFKMAGIEYKNGLFPTSYSGCFAEYNLDAQYGKISGMIGHIDSANTHAGTYKFYGDGKLMKQYDIYAHDMPKDFSFDISHVKQLRIVFEGGGNTIDYGLGNVVLTKYSPNM